LSEPPSIPLSFVLGIVFLSVVRSGWELLTAVDFGVQTLFYTLVVALGLLAFYVSLWQPQRVGLVVVPVHLALLSGYFSIVEWGYRTPSELAVAVVSWVLLVSIVFWNADHFTGN